MECNAVVTLQFEVLLFLVFLKVNMSAIMSTNLQKKIDYSLLMSVKY